MMENVTLVKPEVEEFEGFEMYDLEWTSDDTKDVIKGVIGVCVGIALQALASCT